jgi:hypothetical protein
MASAKCASSSSLYQGPLDTATSLRQRSRRRIGQAPYDKLEEKKSFCFFFVCFWSDSPQWAMAPSFTRFLDHTQWRTTIGRTPLDEWSARRKDLYLTTHNTHDKYPCPRWDSNLRSQQASGRRPTPLGLAADKRRQRIFASEGPFTNESWQRNQSRLQVWAKHCWFLARVSHLSTVRRKQNKGPIFVQVNRSHDATVVHTWQMFVKYASRANTALRR